MGDKNYRILIANDTGRTVFITIPEDGFNFSKLEHREFRNLCVDFEGDARFRFDTVTAVPPAKPGDHYEVYFWRASGCSGEQGYLAMRASYLEDCTAPDFQQFEISTDDMAPFKRTTTYDTVLGFGGTQGDTMHFVWQLEGAAANPAYPKNMDAAARDLQSLLYRTQWARSHRDPTRFERRRPYKFRDPLGMVASMMKEGPGTGPPAITPYEKARWWKPLHEPHPPPPAKGPDIFGAITNVAIMASFAIPEAGPLVAAGLTAMDEFMKAQEAGAGPEARKRNFVQEVADAVDKLVADQSTRDEITRRLTRTTAFHNNVLDLTRGYHGSVDQLREALNDYLPRAEEDLEFLGKGGAIPGAGTGPGHERQGVWAVATDLKYPPTLPAQAIEAYLYALHVWVLAKKLAAKIDGVHGVRDRKTHGRDIVAHLPRRIRDAEATIEAMETAILTRILRIGEPEPVKLFDGDTFGSGVRDEDLSSDGLTMVAEWNGSLLEESIQPFWDGMPAEPGWVAWRPDSGMGKHELIADARSWMVFTFQRYARRWHYDGYFELQKAIDKLKANLELFEKKYGDSP